MSWPSGNVPVAVSAMRDMIVASATWVAMGGTQGRVHYPDVDLTASATVPCINIVQEEQMRQVYASGSGALPSGKLRLDLYQNALAGDVEKNAYGIASDLGASTTGLLIRSVQVGMASDPTPAENAGTDGDQTFNFRAISLHVDFGPTL